MTGVSPINQSGATRQNIWWGGEACMHLCRGTQLTSCRINEFMIFSCLLSECRGSYLVTIAQLNYGAASQFSVFAIFRQKFSSVRLAQIYGWGKCGDQGYTAYSFFDSGHTDPEQIVIEFRCMWAKAPHISWQARAPAKMWQMCKCAKWRHETTNKCQK